MEVADHGMDGQAGVVAGQRIGRLPESGIAHVERDELLQAAVAQHGVEQDAGLLAGAGAQLDQHVGVGRGDDVLGVRIEDRPLAAGRVVLGQPGDGIEEAAAAVVVEIHGRKRLWRGGEPGADV